MAMIWKDTKHRFSYSGGNSGYSLSGEHGQLMKAFRRSHGPAPLVNAPRRNKAARLANLRLLKVMLTADRTGGARSPSSSTATACTRL